MKAVVENCNSNKPFEEIKDMGSAAVLINQEIVTLIVVVSDRNKSLTFFKIEILSF